MLLPQSAFQAPPATPEANEAPENSGQETSPPTKPAAHGKPTEITLQTDEGTKYYPNREYQALYTPNDYHNQWFTNRISAPATWDKSVGSAATKVAVIDTGFALKHDELFNRWAVNQNETTGNATDDDSNGLADDWRGWDFYHGDNDPRAGTTNINSYLVSHGTSVAGMAGAAGNNSLGMVGVNWQTQLLPLQVMNDDGRGFTSDITAAIDYAINQEVDVINLSLGGDAPDPVLEAAAVVFFVHCLYFRVFKLRVNLYREVTKAILYIRLVNIHFM